MPEVFAWPEASLWVFPAGGSSAIMTYAENVSIDVDYGFIKFKNQTTGTFAARTHFQLADKNVTFNFGQLYYGAATFLQANSATAFNAKLVFSAAGGAPNTGEIGIWSAVFNKFGLQGQENGVFHSRVSMLAADISGV